MCTHACKRTHKQINWYLSYMYVHIHTTLKPKNTTSNIFLYIWGKFLQGNEYWTWSPLHWLHMLTLTRWITVHWTQTCSLSSDHSCSLGPLFPGAAWTRGSNVMTSSSVSSAPLMEGGREAKASVGLWPCIKSVCTKAKCKETPHLITHRRNGYGSVQNHKG